jgi:zinc/manganese transport system ATP-binding protein
VRSAASAVSEARRADESLIRLRGADVNLGGRALWRDLTLDVRAGEFLAVLGPNGSGKTTLLRVLLGLQPLSAGTVEVAGGPARRGDSRLGYVPQQRAFDRDLPLRARDLVRLGADGHRFGPVIGGRALRRRVDAALAAVGASAYGDAPVGLLSGGEQQRLRIAQALLGDPVALLCDEPLLMLDLAHQQAMTALLDERRRGAGTAVVFVTHEINPVLPYANRVLYLVGHRWAVGTPAEIFTSRRLSALYGAPVEVVRLGKRILIASAQDSDYSEPDGHTHHLEQVQGGTP